MKIEVCGKVNLGIMVKDIVFVIIGKIMMVGGMGYVVEFCGEVICDFLMEGWMMVCNMVIELGVKVGLIALDEIMFVYLKNCLYVL